MKGIKTEHEEGFGVDQSVLDRILNKLYDFGGGPDRKRSMKNDKKRKVIKQSEREDGTVPEKTSARLDHEKTQVNASHVTDLSISASTSGGAGSLERSVPDVEVVTFLDPRKKLKRAVEPESKPAEGKEKMKKEVDVLSMEKARLDVHRFGITGFQKQQQRVFEQDRAIMLGARPPKRDYVNYKLYQQMIKEKKSKQKQEMDKCFTQRKKKNASGKQKNVKHKSSSSGAEPTGHVGRFKNGMLVLSSKDFQKLTSKVRK